MSAKTVKKVNKATVEHDDTEEQPTPKAPAKPKIITKTTVEKTTTSKKGAKPSATPETAAKSAEIAAKKAAEKKRYEAVQLEIAERGLVTIFNELTPTSVQDKWANVVNMHILETISYIQQQEVRKEGDYNPYPLKEFFLFEDKLQMPGKKKSQVKVGKSDAKMPTLRNKAPLKRGTKHVDEPVEEVPEHDDQPEDHDDTAESSEPATEETKKRNVTSFTRDAKSYLGFLVMRFVDDYWSSPGGKNIKNREEFTKYTYEHVTKDIISHVSRSVVTSVNRMHPLISNLQDRGVPDDLFRLSGTQFPDRNAVIKHMGEYLSDYFKLIGVVLAHQLWVSRKVINQPVIDATIRIIDLGNHEDLLDAKVISDNESDYGLSCGFFQDVHFYNSLAIPKAPKKPKAKTEDKDKPKGKANTNAKGKAKGKSNSRAKKEEDEEETVEQEEPEEDENAEVEEDENVEVDENAEEDENVEDENAEEDEDENAEVEEAAPTKPLKKLR